MQPNYFRTHFFASALVFALSALGFYQTAGSAEFVLASDVSNAATSATQSQSTWRAGGGTLTVSFNTKLLQELNIVLTADGAIKAQELTRFLLPISASDALTFTATPSGNFARFASGMLQSAGRFELASRGKSKSFAGFSARPLAGTPRDLEILDADGVAWFTADHVHFELVDGKTKLRMRNMDLRLTRNAARWLGDATLTGLTVGLLAFDAPVILSAPINLPQSCLTPNWPGTPVDPNNPLLGMYEADVLLKSMSSLDYKRCDGVCDGPGGAADGSLIFAPTATLANSDTDQTADVPWHEKFDGVFAPYQNDQHPFLIWNLYRISSEGQIENIARSGVKHAYLTINVGCTLDCGDNHVLGRACGDVYSSGNNDSSLALGPRREIVPAKGIWARCGSIYDADCDGVNDNPTFSDTEQRLLVPESQISDTENFRYFYESWYVVRDDVNIYNSMGSKEFTPLFSGGLWRSTNEQAMQSGPVIDRWVNPANPGSGNMSTEVILAAGRLKIAVRTKLLPNFRTRYDYAVMNLDYTDATLDASDLLNVRMLDRAGISGFSVPSNQADISNISVSDGEDIITDWAEGRGGSVHFRARSQGSELGWASLYSFSFEANTTPVAGKVTLSGRKLDDDVQVDLLVPGVDSSNLLIDDFE